MTDRKVENNRHIESQRKIQNDKWIEKYRNRQIHNKDIKKCIQLNIIYVYLINKDFRII